MDKVLSFPSQLLMILFMQIKMSSLNTLMHVESPLVETASMLMMQLLMVISHFYTLCVLKSIYNINRTSQFLVFLPTFKPHLSNTCNLKKMLPKCTCIIGIQFDSGLLCDYRNNTILYVNAMISFINVIPSFYDLKEIKVIVSWYYIYKYVFFVVKNKVINVITYAVKLDQI